MNGKKWFSGGSQAILLGGGFIIGLFGALSVMGGGWILMVPIILICLASPSDKARTLGGGVLVGTVSGMILVMILDSMGMLSG